MRYGDPFDSGVAMLSSGRGAPRLYWSLNPINAVRAIGSGIKNAAVGAGHAIGSVASNPWVQGITAAGLAATGVGVPAAAAIMAAERGGGALLKPGGNIGQGVRGGVEGAAIGTGASLLGSGVRRVLGSGGASAVDPRTGAEIPAGGDSVPGDGMDPAYDPGSSGVDAATVGGGVLGKIGGAARKIGSSAVGAAAQQAGGGGFWDAAGNFIKNNAGDIALGGLSAEQAIQAAKASARAAGYQDKSLALADDLWKQGAPLRTAGLSGLQNRTTHDLTDTYGTNQGPFAAKRRKVAV
jgi:hypothetical protein